MQELLKTFLASVLSVAALFVTAKFMGKRQISQLGFFDYITGITIGSIAAEMAVNPETYWRAVLAMAVYLAFSVALSAATRRWMRARKYISGTPTILMDNGKIYRENMEKCKIDLSEFLVMCRQEGYFDLGAVQTAVFEFNGRLSILPTAERRALTPEDMSLSPPKDRILIEIVMDGRILGENLHRMGLDETWLEKQLRAQGYASAREVFLAVCDGQKHLSVYREH